MPKGNIVEEPSLPGSGVPFPIHVAFFLGLVRGVFADTLRGGCLS
jgi:hypothetical protein